ncbi:hypothetical protein MANI_030169 [Metarhizium anisopliae]|nr:hypothetical protein MANI_030169 [Metarhizium anisopliae]
MPVSPYATEAWTEYVLGICVLVARILCRTSVVGMNWDGDDYFAFLAIILWTAELCMFHMIGTHGSLKGLHEHKGLTLTDEEKHNIAIGAKCMLASWCIYVSLIWALKACMLFLYGRLTLDLKQRHMVKITAVACVAAYISLIAVIGSHCTPIQRKWQIHPYPGGASTPAWQVDVPAHPIDKRIADACALGTPMHYALFVTNVRKLLCGIWLCTGGFVVVAAVFRCIICLLNDKKADIALIWSLRETFVGIIATNIPILGPWIARAVHNLRGIHSGGGSKTSDAGGLSDPPGGHRLSRLERRAKENRIRRGLGWTTIRSGSHDRNAKEELELQSKSPSQSDWSGITVSGTGSSGLVH